MKKFEYKSTEVKTSNLNEVLNSLGSDGWMLDTMVPISDGVYRVVLRRPVDSGGPQVLTEE